MANNIKYIHSEKYNKHMTYDMRMTLEKILHDNQDIKLKVVAEMLQKDPTTISKELKKHRIPRMFNRGYDLKNHLCKKIQTCEIISACSKNCNNSYCKRRCNCINFCDKYEEDVCQRLTKFPWVCNGCSKTSKCRKNKYFYHSKESHQSYEIDKVQTRKGINISEGEVIDLNKLLKDALIEKEQPVIHIFKTHKTKIPFSQRTFYNYVQNQVLCVKNHHLRRKVTYKPRKKKDPSMPSKNIFKEYRTYADYLKYLETSSSHRVQMDTVEGLKTDQKCILTIHFVEMHFMLGILLPKQNSASVAEAIDVIQEKLGSIAHFQNLFPSILMDNGKEFYFPENIETYKVTGEIRTNVFYCNPCSSYQKPHIEKNHNYLRYVLPKGKSIDFLSQEDLDLLFSHINSTKRDSTNYSSPYELMVAKFGEEIINKLSIKKIHPTQVNLSKSLLIK